MKVRRVLCFTIDEDDLEYKKLVDEIVVQNMTVVLGDVSFNSRKLPAPPEEYQTFPWPWMISIEFVVKIPNACETKRIIKDFSKLLGNPEFSDFKIVCDKESFPCHKNILASRCDYFSAMFKMANCVENKTGCVDIKDISAQAMKALLKFIYHGEASESDLDVDLIVAADKYRFMELAVQCEDHILNGLSEKSALDILALSTMCPTNRIRDEVTRYIRENNDEEYNKNGEDWANFKTANPPLAIAELLEDVIDTDILAFSTLCPMNIMPDEVRSYIRENVECEFNKNSEDWAKFKTTNPSLAIELLQCIIGLDEEEEEEEEKETKK
jgi:hypothetical protein